MKILITAILIFAIICGVCIYCDICLNNIIKDINKQIDSIHSSVKAGNLKNAESTFHNLKKSWDSKEKFVQIQTEHNELDIINEQIAVISSHFDHNEYDEFYETLYKLEYFLNHITEKKKLNLNTIG